MLSVLSLPSRAVLARLALLLAAGGWLGGCSTGASAVRSTLSGVILGDDPTASAVLNPGLFYERVTLNGHPALLVLGFLDADAQGQTEVWYSHEHEVLRLRNGRLQGTAGMTLNWSGVRFPDGVPAWPTTAGASPGMATAAAAAAGSGPFRRLHAVSPGYQDDIEEHLQLRDIAPPEGTALAGVAPATLRWLEERVLRGPGATLPPARYALDTTRPGRVLYGEQCLAVDFCLSWQRWPVGGATP